MSKHKHAELMMQYAQDAAETCAPWERWERYFEGWAQWHECFEHPHWSPLFKFRRKENCMSIRDDTKRERHPHATAMAEYAYDAMHSERPWENWECVNREFSDLSHHPDWLLHREYRRKEQQPTEQQ